MNPVMLPDPSSHRGSSCASLLGEVPVLRLEESQGVGRVSAQLLVDHGRRVTLVGTDRGRSEDHRVLLRRRTSRTRSAPRSRSASGPVIVWRDQRRHLSGRRSFRRSRPSPGCTAARPSAGTTGRRSSRRPSSRAVHLHAAALGGHGEPVATTVLNGCVVRLMVIPSFFACEARSFISSSTATDAGLIVDVERDPLALLDPGTAPRRRVRAGGRPVRHRPSSRGS